MKNLPPLIPRIPHGGPTAQPFTGLDFSVNTNPHGPNPILLRIAQQADLAHYPDPSYLATKQILAQWHGLNPENVALSVGASDLLHRICRAFLPLGGKLLSLQAPFGELARAVVLQNGEIQLISVLSETMSSQVDLISAGLIYVGYPHNPSGLAPSLPALQALLESCAKAGALLILDEAYMPFISVPPFSISTLSPHPNLIRVLSPGKAHGLVGARPAYALASAKVVQQIENLAPAWHIPASTAAVLAALPNATAFLDETLPLVAQQAQHLAQELQTFVEVEHHGTPYMTLNVKNAASVTQALLAQQIKVRDCSSYGFPERIRVSSRLEVENMTLVRALGGIYGY